jgi:hypothetical protein
MFPPYFFRGIRQEAVPGDVVPYGDVGISFTPATAADERRREPRRLEQPAHRVVGLASPQRSAFTTAGFHASPGSDLTARTVTPTFTTYGVERIVRQ